MSEPAKAVFLSYARDDAAAARRIAEALRASGLEVWFDENELRGGDAWDAKIRQQIDACALFVAVISKHTQERSKGYFRLEWKLAVDQTHLLAAGVPFVAPVVIDDTPEGGALVPPEFLKVQWMRLPGALPTPQFVEQINRLLGGKAMEAGRPRPAIETRGEVAAPPKKSAPFAALWISLGVVAVSVGVVFFVTGRRGATEQAARSSAPPVAVATPDPSSPSPSAPPTAAADKSVAVLPFANLSGDKDQEYFSDGLTEEILNTLARERDLRVPGRASSFSFKGRNVSSSEIAKALNVSRLVEGSVRKSGNKVRISVSLTRAADGFSEELGTFTEEMTDIFALQDKVARAVVEKLTQRAVASASVGLTKSPEAYDAYLKGRALQTRGAENRPAAIKCYEEAVRIDPAFALAWARLAEARFRSYGAQADRSPEVVDGTRAAIDRALAARPDLPEALIMRANWVRAVGYDFVSAKRDLDRAESLQAATSDLRFAQAQLARDLGRITEAFRLYRAAIELDPQNGDFANAFAVGLCWPYGEIVEANRLFRVAMAIQGLGVRVPSGNMIRLRLQWRGPEAALRLLESLPPTQAGLPERRAELLVALGRIDEAGALLDSLESGAGTVSSIASMGGAIRPSLSLLQAVGRTDFARQRANRDVVEARTELARGNRAPGVLNSMIRAQILLGQNDAALAALEEWRAESQRMPSEYRQMSEFMESAAGHYSLLGKTDEAVALLQQLRAKGNRRISPRYNLDFHPIRNDPRVQVIMREDDIWARSLPDPTEP